MIRVAIVADHHFDETSRFQECVEVHEWIAVDARMRGVHAVISCGDVFERKSTIREREAVAAWLRSVADFAPVLVVRGNHDVIEGGVSDLAIFRQLATRHPVIVEETAAVHTLETSAGPLHVAALAWLRPAELAAMALRHGANDDVLGSEATRVVLLNLGHQLQALAGPHLFAAHALVTGSRTSDAQPPLVGHKHELGLADLSLVSADFYALGHVHLSQTWIIDGAPATYPGSPRRVTYGEPEEKGYVVADFDLVDGAWCCVSWERVATPCREMLRVEDEWGAEGWLSGHNLDLTDVQNAEIRFRYVVDGDLRDAARAAAAAVRAELLGRGAVSVMVQERVRATTRARAPEVAAAKTTEDMLVAHWASKGTTPAAERTARLLKTRLPALEAA